MCEPLPCVIQIGCGFEICQLEITPPASEFRARSMISPDFVWVARNSASFCAISSSRRARALSVLAAVIAMDLIPFPAGSLRLRVPGCAFASARQRRGAPLGELVGQNGPLDLRRPFPDALHAKLAVEALGGV